MQSEAGVKRIASVGARRSKCEKKHPIPRFNPSANGRKREYNWSLTAPFRKRLMPLRGRRPHIPRGQGAWSLTARVSPCLHLAFLQDCGAGDVAQPRFEVGGIYDMEEVRSAAPQPSPGYRSMIIGIGVPKEKVLRRVHRCWHPHTEGMPCNIQYQPKRRTMRTR